MSKVMSIRLPDHQYEELARLARQHDRTPSQYAAKLLDEAIRMSEFAFVEFRDSMVGRQAYMQGSRLPVWQVIMILRDYEGDVTKTAEHLCWPDFKVRAALNYAEAFPEEIETALADNASYDFERLKRMLPGLELITVSDRDGVVTSTRDMNREPSQRDSAAPLA